MLIEPTFASERVPIAAFNIFSFLEALISTDLLTLEFSIAIDPTFALERVPIAAFNTFSFFDALINTDLLILEPSANALKETVAATANTIVDTNVFMVNSSVLFKDRYSLSIEAISESVVFTSTA